MSFDRSSDTQLLLRNRYRVIKLIGGGGFGKTFQAEDTDCMNAACVVKQFSPAPSIQANPAVLEKATQLFNQEAERLFQLGEHPQIPRLLAYFEQDNQLYLVQELIEGQDLQSELKQQGTFSEEKIWELLTDLLPVLKIVHSSGVIHRDIKPENIMRRSKDGKLVLIDFGVSKQVTGTDFSAGGTTVGTPGYAPIEQMFGQAYPASDLYSLGVTCICLLTGALPSNGSNNLYDPREDRWIWREHLPQGTSISPTLGQVLNKLLAQKAFDRYQSASEVLQALTDDDLSSEVGVDYSTLRELLAKKLWKEADVETVNVILQAVGRKKEGWIDFNSIKKFPCTDLRTINCLWVKYSNGHFGFSVQKNIWESMRGNADADVKTYEQFCDRIGWHKKGDLFFYSNLTFDLTAPKGHLPSGRVGDMALFVRLVGKIGGFGVERITSMVSKLISCGIDYHG